MKKTALAAAVACLLPAFAHAQIVVKPRSNLTATQFKRLAAAVKGVPIRYLPRSRAYILAPQRGQTDRVMLQKLSRSPSILYARGVRRLAPPRMRVTRVRPSRRSAAALPPRRGTTALARRGSTVLRANSLTAPNDPYYSQQWYLPKIGAPSAWGMATGSPVTVGLIDSGVNAVPDVQGSLVAGWNMVDNNSNTADVAEHGTFMASLIGATCDNALDIAGAACNVRVMPVRVGDAKGYTSPYIGEGVRYAVDHGARVINMSFGTTANEPNMTDDPDVRAAIAYARSRGAIVVVSAGNDGAPLSWRPDPDVILVAGTDQNDGRAGLSNYGSIITLSAPATAMQLIGPDNAVYTADGTSGSAGLVSATIAMMLSVNPSLTFDQVKSILASTAVPLSTPGMGAGRLNAAAAVQAAAGRAAPVLQPAPAQPPQNPTARNPFTPPQSGQPAAGQPGNPTQAGGIQPIQFPGLGNTPIQWPTINGQPLVQPGSNGTPTIQWPTINGQPLIKFGN